MSLVRAPNPIWFFVDLVGQPLNDTYFAFFLENTLPYLPQAVFQDPNGIDPWSNPIEFLPNGTLPDNLYFPESATYRIEIRQGPTQADPLIYVINNFVVGAGGGGVESDDVISSVNSLTNPQFADLSVPSGWSTSTAGTYNIAPGWKLVLTGSGLTTITQVANAGSNDVFSNPPYYLTLTNSGWASVQLIQQFNNNGALFAGGALTLSFMAFATGSPQTVTVSYNPSNLANAQQIFSGIIQTGGFQTYYGAIPAINDSNNTDVGTAAFTQIIFALPSNSTLSLTNVQILGQSTNLSDAFVLPSLTTPGSVPPFHEISYEQTVNNEFFAYRNAVVVQSKDSILTGWNFGLNPWQFKSKALVPAATQCGYHADQTIIRQQAANTVSVGGGGFGFDDALTIRAITASNKFAVIQYIDAETMSAFWDETLSALVSCVFIGAVATTCRIKMRLIYRTTLPPTLSAAEPIVSFAGTDPVFAAGWTAIAPENDPEYLVNSAPNFAFNRFRTPLATTADMTLGVVLYTTTDMNPAAADELVIEEISLVQNDFGMESNPITFDECLRQCEYYYEKSYDNIFLPGTITGSSQIMVNQGFQYDGTKFVLFPNAFSFRFDTVKRAAPVMTFYSPASGVAGTAAVDIYVNSVLNNALPESIPFTDWTPTVGTKGYSAIPISQFPGPPIHLQQTIAIPADPNLSSGIMRFHYTADARLGL